MYNTSSMNKLREIILGLKPDELYKLQQWLTDKDTFSEEVANILPSSVIKSIELSLPLGDVLMPIIEESIFASVQNNPKALADALFPIMGPAIRKSISDTFRSFIETLNQTLENRFSLKRIRWRLLSIFSSKSYAEIVLLNSISFNVKHIFLIHKETGLLIQDYSESGTTHESADMISSMLTAVQDFVKDSFAGDIRRDDSLDTIRLNELNVWIEAGPYAILAVIFDGMAPESMRIVFKEILEELHHKFGKLMKSFDGNSNAFTMVRSYLKKCAIKQKPKKTKNKKSIILLIILIATSGIWVGLHIRSNHRWDKFTEALSQQPGVVIINQGKHYGKHFVIGMKDKASDNYYGLAAKFKIDTSKTEFIWKNYISLEDTFIIERIKKILPPNEKVSIYAEGGKIHFEGEADEHWIAKAKQYAASSKNIFETDFSLLKNNVSDSLRKIENKISDYRIIFKRGVYNLNDSTKKVLNEVLKFCEFYSKNEKNYVLSMTITPDSKGDTTINYQFAKYRLISVNNYLNNKLPKIKTHSKISPLSQFGYRTLIFNIKKQ